MKENNFTFVSTFYKDLAGLPYELRCKAVEALCYWGVYRELPPEIGGTSDEAIIGALLANAKRMIEGQDAYKEKKAEEGKKGGAHARLSDEEILNVYFDFRKQGIMPSENKVIEKCGGGVSRIYNRPVWQNREQLWKDYCNNVTNDSYNNTTIVSNNNNDYNKVTKNVTNDYNKNSQESKPSVFNF